MSEYNIQMNKYNALNAEYDQLYPATKIENVDGLNTALQNKAPAGYGLGELSGKVLTASDNIDNIRVSGIYTYSWNPSNQPSGLPAEAKYHTGLLIVTAGVQSTVEQKIVFVKNASAVNTGDNCTVHRLSLGTSAWQPWEWVNPPMDIGKEYRTTERYQGKPVYVMAVDFGNLPTSGMKTVAHGINNIKYVCSVIGTMSNGTTIPYDYSDSEHWNISGDKRNIMILATGDLSSLSAYATIKYTKTTD